MSTLNAAFVGKVLMHFDELPSTNDYARLIANQHQIAEGTVVSADCQTSGRGQMGTTWESAPGDNLTLSVILKPDWLRADLQFGLSKAVALAVHATVFETISPVFPASGLHIKWPNDILLNDKKIAGILIENTISGQHLGISIIGIGLNINQQQFSPALPHAASLKSITGLTFDTEHIRNRLFFHLENRYLQLKNGHPEKIHEDYLQHLYRINKLSAFDSPVNHTTFFGTITGVSDVGKLIILTGGVEHQFGLKEVILNLDYDR